MPVSACRSDAGKIPWTDSWMRPERSITERRLHMATSLFRWASGVILLSCALSPCLRAQGPSCATVVAVAGPPPSVSFEATTLKIRVQGQFRQDGDLSAYTVTPGEGATTFSREL